MQVTITIEADHRDNGLNVRIGKSQLGSIDGRTIFDRYYSNHDLYKSLKSTPCLTEQAQAIEELVNFLYEAIAYYNEQKTLPAFPQAPSQCRRQSVGCSESSDGSRSLQSSSHSQD